MCTNKVQVEMPLVFTEKQVWDEYKNAVSIERFSIMDLLAI